jgi:metal-dependent amidase/aminoacylase/carboxypeptidase family protein
MSTTPETLAPLHADMTAWRQDIHAHPELGFQETRTADKVARQMEAWPASP